MTSLPAVEAGAIWLARLDPSHEFSATEREMVLSAFSSIEFFSPRSLLWKEGQINFDPFLLVEGMVACLRHTLSGRRQILAILVPGDLCDGEEPLLPPAGQSVFALSVCRAAFVPEQKLLELERFSDRLTRALGELQLEQRRTAREWLVNLGCRSAAGRLANFFCEMYERLGRMGLVRGTAYDLPLTQQDLAEVTGLSVIHVNRVLQQFRRDELIRFSAGVLEVLDLERLQALGEFSPGTLYMRERSPPRAGSATGGGD